MSLFIVTITLLCHPEQSEGSVITLLSKKILHCVQDDRMITMLYAKTKSVLFKVDLFILRKSVLICVSHHRDPRFTNCGTFHAIFCSLVHTAGIP